MVVRKKVPGTLGPVSRKPEPTPAVPEGNGAVITVLGADRVGIAARVTAEIAEVGGNIVDMRSTLMGSLFTMIILLDTSAMTGSLEDLQKRLDRASRELKVQIHVQHEAIFRFMHRV